MQRGVAAVARQLQVDQTVPSAPKLPPGREGAARAFAEIYEQHLEHARAHRPGGEHATLHAAVSSGREDDIVCYLAAKCPEAARERTRRATRRSTSRSVESRSKVVNKSLKRAAKEALRA